MNIRWPWKREKITLEKDIKSFEKHLETLFQPVTPRPEFIKKLRSELVGEPEEKPKALLKGKWQKGFLVAGGVVSFFAMVLGGIRIVIAILGLVRMNKKDAIEEPIGA
ncbi:MAG: hypothetical protein GWN14_08350 [candidate division Zixibacteria bacterium]|nr:hypothetical protein [Gammaproteobacteria bacterium]NIX55921.1 hypothetical protein [candidate division Zixibacteria bacterium]